ncbi:MAG: iron-siderophore ABC transporter substrate-binding protein [Solirubrobacteraceae bacterium]|nr:iron-siderophore ABC transporter substrate-binding protein [Solirubrobacteraceae bacterium]
MRRQPLRIVTLLAALAVGLLVAAPAHAAAKRVVALEWDAVENLRALGVKPVGAADLRGYRTYVSIKLPTGITDVGTRGEPSIERIASLRPDLIIVPRNRSGRNLSSLRKIARVLQTNPYPGSTASRAHYNAMLRDFRAIGRAVGKSRQAESVLRDMTSTFSSLRQRLARANRRGTRVTIATPGGTASSPALRLFTSNSAAAEIVRRLGLRSAWSASPARYGFTTTGVEALRQIQTGWLAFVYPTPFVTQIKRFTDQDAYKRLAMVRANRVRKLQGNTWLFGGPLSSKVFAQRLTAALT